MTECCNCQKTGVFYDHLMIFYHIKECNNQFIIINCDHIIQIFLQIREDMLSRCLYSGTICNRIYMWKCYDLTLFKRCFHTCSSGWLHTDNFDMWIEEFCKRGNTCCKTASADRNKNVIYKRKLLYNFHCNCTLACCNGRIIKRMDKGISLFFCKLQCIGTSFIIDVTFQNNFSTVTLCTFYFDKWCGGRHNDHGFCSEFVCRISHTLCMVSC